MESIMVSFIGGTYWSSNNVLVEKKSLKNKVYSIYRNI